ncbi:MAG TPA: T9SS type A sorting domain-containing protein, partial [Chitinophagales bacterium]|nr:T9SS type A sorting domain-containing protein [Chitinophagales bacterium]
EELTEAPVEIFDVYPNPTDEVVNINMELNTENTEAQIFIVNIMGDVVYSRDAAINNGTLSEVITLDDQVAAGLYFVKVYVGNKEYSQQLVIQK